VAGPLVSEIKLLVSNLITTCVVQFVKFPQELLTIGVGFRFLIYLDICDQRGLGLPLCEDDFHIVSCFIRGPEVLLEAQLARVGLDDG
jgi:hypothetical protein